MKGKFLVIHPNNYDYTDVITREEFEKSYGNLHADYRPRIDSSHESYEAAEARSKKIDAAARRKYSR